MSLRFVCAPTYSFQLDFGVGCCFVFDAWEEASLAYSFQLNFEDGCCLTVDALEDEAWPAYSFHVVGVALATEGPRTLEGNLPDQAELLVLVLPKPWTLEGKLLRGSTWTAFTILPFMMVDCSCCLLVARRCGGLLLFMVTRILCS